MGVQSWINFSKYIIYQHPHHQGHEGFDGLRPDCVGQVRRLPGAHRLLEENVGSNASEDRNPVKPEAVIVTPTMELARQIHRQAKKFAQGSVLRAVVANGET